MRPVTPTIQRFCTQNTWNQYFAGTPTSQPFETKDFSAKIQEKKSEGKGEMRGSLHSALRAPVEMTLLWGCALRSR